MATTTVFSRETLRPLRVVSYSDLPPTVGAGEAHLAGELWPDYLLVVTASDAGDELLSAVPCPPIEPLPRHGYVHTLDEQSWTWSAELTLEGARDARWQAIKADRAAAEVAPLVVAGRIYDADAESQRRIAGAVQLAVIAPAGWEIAWTLTDNSVATLTAAEMIAVGVALGEQVAAAHATGRTLRAQLDAAETVSQINAVTWPAS